MAGCSLENNKLIAEFLGWRLRKMPVHMRGGTIWMSQHTTSTFCAEEGRELFHESWDWLMPVVDKIRLMDRKVTIEAEYYVAHSTNRAEIMNFRTFPKEPKIVVFYRGAEGTLLNATYEAVVEFIQWYNTQKDGIDKKS